MKGFTKLFTSITTSSIWNEDDKTRIVWITLLALCGPDGKVGASVGGLAHTARVSRADCQKALDVLEAPDPDSRSPEFEGRRVEKIEGGFRLLNYGKYRDARTEGERKEYMREYMKNWRESRKQERKLVNSGEPELTDVNQTLSASASSSEGLEEKRVQREGKARGTMEQCVAYALELKLPTNDGEWFYDKCEGSGWKNNGKAIADWKATMRTWNRTGGIFPSQKPSGNGHDLFRGPREPRPTPKGSI